MQSIQSLTLKRSGDYGGLTEGQKPLIKRGIYSFA